MAGGGNDVNRDAERARSEEEARQAKIRAGSAGINSFFDTGKGVLGGKTLRGPAFDDAFFSGLQKDYMDYAEPQLQEQSQDAGEALTYHLADAGLLDSSVRGEKTADLKETHALARQGLQETGRDFANRGRESVEDARGDLISMFQATGDTQAVGSAALGRAGALATQPAYSPLGALFAEFTAGLGTQAGLERARAAGSPVVPRYNTGIFAPDPRAVRNR